jgi:hypothetical protein
MRPRRNGERKGHFLAIWLGRVSAAALLLLAACLTPLPPGLERLASAIEASAFAWSPTSRRLIYVEGRFPHRTYLVVLDRASGRRRRTRLKGYVLGAGAALSRDGRRVLLDAGKLAPNAASRSEPTQRVVLEVDSGNGRIVSETPIGSAGTAALGHPAWSPEPVAVWNDRDGLSWKASGGGASGFLRGPGAWRALLLDEPYVVVSEKQTAHPRLSVYDLRTGQRCAEWPVALTAAPLAVRLDGTALSARWMSETGSFALEAGDPKTGRRTPLLEAEGEIESAVETTRGLYAIAKDTSRHNDTGKDFLAPRVLLALETSGRRWKVPWTAHRGELLGADPVSGRLLFAVTDRDKPGVWAFEPSPRAAEAAARTIDGG